MLENSSFIWESAVRLPETWFEKNKKNKFCRQLRQFRYGDKKVGEYISEAATDSKKERDFLSNLVQRPNDNDVKDEESDSKKPRVRDFFEICFFLRDTSLNSSPREAVKILTSKFASEPFLSEIERELFRLKIKGDILWKDIWRDALDPKTDLRGANLYGFNLTGFKLAGACLVGTYLPYANLTGADLSGADLSCADLRGADLRRANLTGANLSCADLRGADLRRANLCMANLHGVKLIGADLRGVNLSGANLHGVKLIGADLRGADLRRANLIGADLRGADLRRANLTGADLRRANLTGADLYGANLTVANLDGAKLYRANLDGAKLDGAKLYRANLIGADLRGVNLRCADHLSEVNLRGFDLSGADLSGADLSGADLGGANLTGANLCMANLHGVNLTGAYLNGAYLIGADFHGADLFEANLTGAYLHGADLRRANFSGAKLHRADLSGTKLSESIFDGKHEATDLSGAKLFSGDDFSGDDFSEINCAAPDEDKQINDEKRRIQNLEARLEHLKPIELFQLNDQPISISIFDIYKKITGYISLREERRGITSKLFQPGDKCDVQKLKFITDVGHILIELATSCSRREALLNTMGQLNRLAVVANHTLRPRKFGNAKYSLSTHFQTLLDDIQQMIYLQDRVDQNILYSQLTDSQKQACEKLGIFELLDANEDSYHIDKLFPSSP